MRLAAFQMEARAGDIAANLALIETAAVEARSQSADLLVVPELATVGYGAGTIIRDLAEPIDGAQVARLAAIATENRLGLVAGFPERAGEAVYNSAVLLAPDARPIVHRKCQLYGAYEKALFTPGPAAPRLTEFRGRKLGMLICYDAEFPEYVRSLALAGAELIAVPTAVPASEQADFILEKVIPVRAFENQIAIVYADHAGADQNFAYGGRSCIVMPDGADAARAGRSGATLIVADYEPARYEMSRAANPYLADLRSAAG